MDARDRLRRYLEQRRELGESELILDGMPVEDVMAMLGVRAGSVAAPVPKRAPPDRAVADRAVADRAVDRATAEPGDDPSMAERGATAAPAAEAPVAPSVPISPPEPEVRFTADTSTDWRETLRRAGAMKPEAPATQGASAQPPAANAPGAPSSTPRAPETLVVREPLPVSAPAWLTALGAPLGLSAGDSAARGVEPVIGALPTLEAIAEMTRACTRCDLYRTATHAVPGEGNPDADFVCVGEAPGQSEDEQGRPFVGAAGALLNKILAAIQLGRDDVFICNVIKHRPPGNRDPLPDEVVACEPYLRRQLELIQPRVILALGRFAAQSLLQTTTPIGKLRGQVHRYHGTPLIVTYHPAALLRNEAWKRPAWEDVKLARRVLDASRAASGA